MADVSNDVIVNRAKDYFKVQLNKSLELALLLPTDPLIDIDFEISGAEQLAAEMREALKKQHFSHSVQSDARALLNPTNPDADTKPSDAFQFACNAVLRAKIESARILAAQLGGEYHETAPKDPWFAGLAATDLPPIPGDEAKAGSTGSTFGMVAKQFFDFKSKNDWAPKTAADVKRVIALATELVGADKPMTSLGIDDVKCVRDALASVPSNYMKVTANSGLSIKEAVEANVAGASLSVKTQDKYFTMFKQILIFACNEGYLDKVPGANVKVAGVKKLIPGEQRDPYSPEQLVKIFSSPVYTGHKSEECRHKPGQLLVRDGYFWVPLIGLFSGMRLGEILQLLKTDVKLENDVWFFDITKGEGKSLKTASSKRRVPIHRTLIDIGLLDYVQSGQQAGRIFPEIKKGADGYHSHHFSKWWGRFAGHVGFKSSRTAFHSFRHNFLDALRAAETPEYINKALAGHSDKSVHSQYGGGAMLSQLKSAVDKVSYAAVDLSSLI
ncbi:site-specific integrase [Bradyrhizobium neotropicale]|nr:site-specific integrase [Bradyrhizobium neotropicale]